MNIVLWIIAGALAAAFLFAGITKVSQSKDKLASNMPWTEDFGPGTLKVIGLLEVLAAVGLILPAALDIVPVLVPLAAIGLVLLMVGAIITHLRRHEASVVVVNVVLLLLAAVVAWGRLGPESFVS